MSLEGTVEEQDPQQPKRIKTLQSSQTSIDSESVSRLPSAIIFEILSRVPVESLLRFRSVCKSWCSMISAPHFVKSHLSLSSSNNRYAHHRLIFSTVRKISVKSCRLYDVYDGSIDAIELDYPLKHPLNSVGFAGSCNGLFLIANEDNVLCIWNPSTRRSNILPSCTSKGRPGYFELGYDEATDDYKVVGISCVFRDGDEHDNDTIVNIYSLKTGNWTTLGGSHNDFPSDLSVKYCHGALHWFAVGNSWKIVSLDLAKETYNEILQPEYDEGPKDLTLGALGESLCVLCDYGRHRADVWVMKVYGVKDSWTKLIYMTEPGWKRFSMPLCISNNGKVLLQLCSKLILYDCKSRSSSEIENFDECLEAYTFVESLVSPNSEQSDSELISRLV